MQWAEDEIIRIEAARRERHAANRRRQDGKYNIFDAF